jgi:hypothetical protein
MAFRDYENHWGKKLMVTTPTTAGRGQAAYLKRYCHENTIHHIIINH